MQLSGSDTRKSLNFTLRYHQDFFILLIGMLFFLTTFVLPLQLSAEAYLWPTNASQLLSSSFGEYRPGHFHAGIDFKTWGKTGYPIYAIESGSVIRMRVSPYGYGKAVYFQLDNGFIVVYGHLSRFNDRLNPFIEEAQEKHQQYKTDLSFPVDQLRFQKGDVLGFTGRTGIGVPHLHFEVRDGDAPFNPLYLGYPIKDHRRPVFQACAFSLKSATGHVNSDVLPVIVKAQAISAGQYQLKDPIYCSGDIGLAISCYDQVDEAYNKLAVYRLSLIVDGIPVYSTQYDRFKYSESGLIDIERDCRLKHWGLGTYQKLYRDPENTLKFSWPRDEGAGILKCQASGSNKKIHHFEIIAGDFFGNESRLTGQIFVKDKNEMFNQNLTSPVKTPDRQSLISHQIIDDKIRFEVFSSSIKSPYVWAWRVGNPPEQMQLDSLASGYFTGAKALTGLGSGLYIINYDLTNSETRRTNRIVESFNLYHIDQQGETLYAADSLFSVRVPSNCFYQPYWGYVLKDTSRSVCYRIYPEDIPLKRAVKLQFETCKLDSALISYLGVYRINGNGKPSFAGAQLKKNQLMATTHQFGKFQVLVDTVAPVIHWMYPKDNQWLQTSKPVLSASFEDTLSGISDEADYRFYLDGKMMIVALDPEENLSMSFVKEPLASGKHEFLIHIKDNAGNEIKRSHVFYTP